MKLNFIILIAIVSLCSCKKDTVTGSGGADPNSIDYLASGTETYVWTFQTNDSLGHQLFGGKDSVSVRIVGTGDVQGKYSDLICLEATSLLEKSGSAKSWYQRSNNSLIEVADLFSGAVPEVLPKARATRASFIFDLPVSLQKIMSSKFSTDDSAQLRDEARVVHRYPLTVGTKWVSFRQPFLSEREVVDVGFVTVAAGSFYCSKIKTTIDLGDGTQNDMEWYDYVCTQGLILRTFYFPNVLITDESDPDGGSKASIMERLELVKR